MNLQEAAEAAESAALWRISDGKQHHDSPPSDVLTLQPQQRMRSIIPGPSSASGHVCRWEAASARQKGENAVWDSMLASQEAAANSFAVVT